MRILAGILMSLYLGLTLLGLYQYKAHNRSWGMKLVVWMSGVVLLVGVGMRFKSVLLPLFFGLGFCLAYFVGWRAVGTRFTGWKQHLVRGVAFAVCLGPLAAVRHFELEYFDHWLLSAIFFYMSSTGVLRFLFYGLPGFFLVGAVGVMVSAGQEIWQRAAGRFTVTVSSRQAKLGYGLILLVLLPCVNWYIAGAFLYSSLVAGQTRILKWALWSRPGSVNAKVDGRWGPPLHMATVGGQTKVAKILLAAGADVNAKNKHGQTPLHEAAGYGRAEIVKLLLKAGAKVNAKNRWGETPLHDAAALRDNAETAKILLEAGAEVNAKNNGGRTPLHLAAQSGQTEVVKILLVTGADINAKDKAGDTPLHEAARHGHPEVVKILLAAGAKVNAKDEDGATPLHRAASRGHIEVARLLIKAGAKVNAKHKDGKTPLDRTIDRGVFIDQKKLDECVELLRKHGAKTGAEIDWPLHVAAREGDTKTVKALIKTGAKLNAKDSDGYTPLHCAAYYGETKVAKMLTDAAAEVNVKSGFAMTPLHVAAGRGHPKAAKVLIDAGADVNAKDKDGRTPLDKTKDRKSWINPRKQDECADLLRKHGAKTGSELDAEAEQRKKNE